MLIFSSLFQKSNKIVHSHRMLIKHERDIYFLNSESEGW
jgi:hypothetical protein